MTTQRKVYQPLAGPITADDAEQEPAETRTFSALPICPYPRRQYTIDAVSPAGFPVHLTFADIKLTELSEHIAALARLGYTPPAAPTSAPAEWRTLPDGTPICPKHNTPMRQREKQGDAWWSHNVGTKDKPIYCKGYHGKDSPGYEVDV